MIGRAWLSCRLAAALAFSAVSARAHAQWPVPSDSRHPVVAVCCDASPPAFGLADTVPGLLRAGGNAAALATDLPGSRGRVRVDAGGEAGGLRRPQSAASSRAVALRSAGERELGNGWQSSGRFTYERRTERTRAWGNVLDAYGRTPYAWADSVGGDWSRDDVSLGASVGSPATSRVGVGVTTAYTVSEGARQNDPRPLARARFLELTPGVSWRVGRHRVGATVSLVWDREDDEIGGGTSPDDPVVFRLRGLGTFDRTQLVSADRATIGQAAGAGLQYAGAAGAWLWSAAADARVRTDDVRDGIASPVTGGSARRETLGGGGAVRRSDVRGGQELDVHAAHDRLRGTDPVFGAVNVTDNARSGTARVRWWRGASPVAGPIAVAVTTTATHVERRDVVAETRWALLRAGSDVDLTGRLPRGRAALLGALRIGWSTAAHATYYAARPTALTALLVHPDYLANAATRTSVAGAVGAEWPARDASRHRIELGASVLHAGAFAGLPSLGNRTSFRLSYSLL